LKVRLERTYELKQDIGKVDPIRKWIVIDTTAFIRREQHMDTSKGPREQI